MYDIFVISKNENDLTFIKLKERFPLVKLASSWEHAKQKTFTKFFWVVWSDLIINANFKFDYQVIEWDTDYIHVFKNGEFFDGVCLFPKSKLVTQRELAHRFFVDKKEIDVQASTPVKYNIFYINTFDEYQVALDTASTDMFWIVPHEIEPLLSFKFDLYFSHHNSYDRRINHVFKNIDIEEEKYNGIMLLSKFKPLSKREFNYRFPIEKKEYSDVASKLKLYDIVFISYNEPNAEENWKKLKESFPRAQRIHGVKGIHNAHIAAANLTSTPMFWVVDGDAVIEDSFDFSLLLPHWDQDTVYVWRSRNPINNLEYGYGGVKLLPRTLTLNMDVSSVDMTTSISKKFKAMLDVSNVTSFNTDPFSSWRSAFRECTKLAVINNAESNTRLDAWCSLANDVPYGFYAYAGAIAGRAYGEKNASNPEALAKINDFTWLQDLWSLEKSQLLPEHKQ